MKIKYFVIIGLCGFIAVAAGTLVLTALWVKKTVAAPVFMQESSLVESGETAWKAYSTQPAPVAMWELSNYLHKIDDVYTGRPNKDREYYYMCFVGHARLAKIYRDTTNKPAEAVQLGLAGEAMKHWSTEKSPNEENIFAHLADIDRLDAGTNVSR